MPIDNLQLPFQINTTVLTHIIVSNPNPITICCIESQKIRNVCVHHQDTYIHCNIVEIQKWPLYRDESQLYSSWLYMES